MLHLPEEVDLNNLLNGLRSCCWTASDILLNYSQKIKDKQSKSSFVQTKVYDEPVTLADLEVNNLIFDYFYKEFSEIKWAILSEETSKTQFENKFNDGWLWILDPLDGTKDFIQKSGNYATHLALNFNNKPIFGLVLIPSKNELWIANGNEVWCENKNRVKKSPEMSLCRNIGEMTIVTSKNHKNQTLNNLINKIGFKNSISMGSIGCKIASILRGEADIYISLSLPGQSSPKDWDFAAPAAVLQQAGGCITDLHNREISYNKKDFKQEGIIIASSNKDYHREICLEIKRVFMKNKIPFF